jgi:DNA processing protein
LSEVAEIRLSDRQRRDWLRLIRSEQVGPRTFRALINRFGGASEALASLPELGRQRLGRAIAICSEAEIDRELVAADRLGVRFVALGEVEYPTVLRNIADPPPILAVKGSTNTLSQPGVAIVGARNASALGRRFAADLAREIGRTGYVIVSGLARGIDAAAHEASVDSGTVAVLAGGHDRLYPPDHAPLAERIVAHGGALISEMPLSWEPRGRDFPRRNRIVSGLALGVVVVEAARRSGSLITARFALEQGREVFAAPGSPLDPRAEGANDLIRNGATLVLAAEHVTEALAPLLGAPKQPFLTADEGAAGGDTASGPYWDELGLEEPGRAAPKAETSLPRNGAPANQPATPIAEDGGVETPEARVLAMISHAPTDIDEIARRAGLPAREVHRIILELEIGGQVERQGANAVSLVA